MQKKSNNKPKTDSSVKVLVRIRPLINIENGTKNIVSTSEDEKSVTVQVDQYNVIETKVDLAISEYNKQEDLFYQIKPFIKQILNSFNLTIFAYGQTGSGKTYTMFGKDWEDSIGQTAHLKKSNKKQTTPLQCISQDSGIIPRTAHQLFACAQQFQSQHSVFCSFLQIYNEKVFDLLNDHPTPNHLSIHESKSQGIFVQGLGQFEANDYTDCLELLRRGEKNRRVRQTSMNAKSSRSHTIFKFMVQSKKLTTEGFYTKASLNLCDLAGSQKINKNQKMASQHLQQLKNINLSLTTLGKVIYALSQGQAKNKALFRQSKLTRLLQQSLIGNTNTVIIGAISPSSKNLDQTISTLKFVERAKHIKLKFKPNLIAGQSNDMVVKLQHELMLLKQQARQKQKSLLPQNIQEKMTFLEFQNYRLMQKSMQKQNQLKSLMTENQKMKYQLGYMEKLARYQVYGVSDRAQSSNSSVFSQKQQKKQTRHPRQKQAIVSHPVSRQRYQSQRQHVALPYLIKQSEKKNQIKAKVDKRSKQQIFQQKQEIVNRLQGIQHGHKNYVNNVLHNDNNSSPHNNNSQNYYSQNNKPRKNYRSISQAQKDLVKPTRYRNSNQSHRKQHKDYNKVNRTLELPEISKQTFSAKPKNSIDYRTQIKNLEEKLRKK